MSLESNSRVSNWSQHLQIVLNFLVVQRWRLRNTRRPSPKGGRLAIECSTNSTKIAGVESGECGSSSQRIHRPLLPDANARPRSDVGSIDIKINCYIDLDDMALISSSQEGRGTDTPYLRGRVTGSKGWTSWRQSALESIPASTCPVAPCRST